jgi:hypothetical protein
VKKKEKDSKGGKRAKKRAELRDLDAKKAGAVKGGASSKDAAKMS